MVRSRSEKRRVSVWTALVSKKFAERAIALGLTERFCGQIGLKSVTPAPKLSFQNRKPVPPAVASTTFGTRWDEGGEGC